MYCTNCGDSSHTKPHCPWVACYKCGQSGHLGPQCLHPRPHRIRICWTCKKTGHTRFEKEKCAGPTGFFCSYCLTDDITTEACGCNVVRTHNLNFEVPSRPSNPVRNRLGPQVPEEEEPTECDYSQSSSSPEIETHQCPESRDEPSTSGNSRARCPDTQEMQDVPAASGYSHAHPNPERQMRGRSSTGAYPKTRREVPQNTGAYPKTRHEVPQNTGAYPKQKREVPRTTGSHYKTRPCPPRQGLGVRAHCSLSVKIGVGNYSAIIDRERNTSTVNPDRVYISHYNGIDHYVRVMAEIYGIQREITFETDTGSVPFMVLGSDALMAFDIQVSVGGRNLTAVDPENSPRIIRAPISTPRGYPHGPLSLLPFNNPVNLNLAYSSDEGADIQNIPLGELLNRIEDVIEEDSTTSSDDGARKKPHPNRRLHKY